MLTFADSAFAFLNNPATVMWMAIVLIVGITTIPGAILLARRNRAELDAIVKLSQQGHSVEEIEQLLKRRD